MTMPDPVDQAPAEEVFVNPRSQAEPPAGRTTLRSLMTLGLALGALAFLAWMVVVHPNHQSLFGPAPSPQAVAVSQPHSAGG